MRGGSGCQMTCFQKCNLINQNYSFDQSECQNTILIHCQNHFVENIIKNQFVENIIKNQFVENIIKNNLYQKPKSIKMIES